jgi:hypothetical protein
MSTPYNMPYRSAAVLSSSGDYYFALLAVLLLGYAIFGKLFAYVGVAPLYVGESVFLLGIAAFLHSRCALASFYTSPMLLLALLMCWVVFRMVPYVGEYGVDALRDSVIILYGGFAFIITALLLERPERLSLIIRFFRLLGTLVVFLAPFLIVLRLDTSIMIGGTPLWLSIKPGTLGVHLAGAALLALLGFRRAGIGWLVFLVVAMVLAAMQTRGGMLAIIIPLIIAMIATGRVRVLAFIAVIAVGLIGLMYVLDSSIQTSGLRDISTRQLVDNFVSIFDASDTRGDLEGTKSWRLAWWDTILDYTFHGPYFWTGKGFGINLATADGFLVGTENLTAPLLRSPHSCHFTILARTGIPGLALWLLTLVSWSATLLINMVRARKKGDDSWADFFILIFCYALGFLIEGTFDVALEGPVSGIWFWCLFGVGIGATMVYRAAQIPAEAYGVDQGSPQTRMA